MDADGPSVLYRLNGDTGANYYRHALYGDGTTASASASTDGNKVLIEALVVGHSASYGFVNITDFLDYTNTNKYKVSRTLSGTDWNGSGEVNFISGQWRSTSAITSIELSINSATRKFSSGTKYALYGIRG